MFARLSREKVVALDFLNVCVVCATSNSCSPEIEFVLHSHTGPSIPNALNPGKVGTSEGRPKVY